MRAYPEDLRKKIVAAIERGTPKAQAARAFDVSLSSVKRYARSARRGESLTPKKSTGRPPKADEKARALLEKDVEERPSATLSERRRFLEHITGTDMSDSTVRRLMKRPGFSQKTDRGGAGTRRVLESRLDGDGRRTSREPEWLVFVDEMGTNTSSSPLYAWAKKGQRAYCSVPRNRGANTTVLSSMSAGGMGPSLAVEGTTTSNVLFEAYVEQVLAPTLRSGQVMVMDDLSAHKGERVKGMVEQRGCRLVYLPAYPPDLNPISRRPSPRERAW